MDAPSAAGSAADAAYGALLGACVGDAAGAVLEFIYRMPAQEEVEAAMRMPGGGVWDVGPGQITDDTEMALCLAQALADCPASSCRVSLDAVASWYGKWFRSPPFDIGNTTRAALTAAKGQPQVEGLAAKMQELAAESNQESLSNGCLMRISPMAVWSCRQRPDVIADNAAADTSLTHPHQTAQVATSAYCIAIAHLVHHQKDAAGSLAAAQDWLQQGLAAALQAATPACSTRSSACGAAYCSNRSTVSMAGSVASSSGCGSREHCDSPRDVQARLTRPWETVLEWLAEAQQDGPGPEVHQAAGYMKWGFVHAFRVLLLCLPFEEAIRQVLLLGGDTDTNATVVGGLLGAYWGAAAIPDHMKAPLLARTAASPGQKRPSFLQTAQLPQLFDKLWAAANK